MNRGPTTSRRLAKMASSLTAGAGAASAPFGSWPSPITSALMTSSSLRLGTARAESGYVVWNEGRPQEGGRQVLVRADVATGETVDITPPGADWNVRTTVHEYGGGEYLCASLSSSCPPTAACCPALRVLLSDGTELAPYRLGPGCETVYFSNFSDQRLYAQLVGDRVDPKPLTAPDSVLRFADCFLDAPRNRLIAIVEDHTDDRPSAVKNFIGAVSLDGEAEDGTFSPVVELVGGADFYASPKLALDGNSLAWVSWEHPNMPWDNTCLSVGEVAEDGSIGSIRVVCGDKDPQAVMAPRWSPANGKLHFITDTNGWWNIYVEESPGGEIAP